MDTTTATAARVEAARIEAGISRLALAEKSGIARTTLNRILDGFRPATVSDIDCLAAALGVDPTTLVDFRAVA